MDRRLGREGGILSPKVKKNNPHESSAPGRSKKAGKKNRQSQGRKDLIKKEGDGHPHLLLRKLGRFQT